MRSKKRLLAALVLVTSLLTSCAGVNSNPSACPQVRPYTKAFQNRLADELAALPEGSVLVIVVADYSQLRKEVLACR